MRRRSPVDPSEPILDFPLALMLTPMLLLGVAVGVLGNNLLPTWLITLLLIVLLFTLAYHTLRKAIKLHHKEKKAAAGRAGDAGPKPGKGLPQAQARVQLMRNVRWLCWVCALVSAIAALWTFTYQKKFFFFLICRFAAGEGSCASTTARTDTQWSRQPRCRGVIICCTILRISSGPFLQQPLPSYTCTSCDVFRPVFWQITLR